MFDFVDCYREIRLKFEHAYFTREGLKDEKENIQAELAVAETKELKTRMKCIESQLEAAKEEYNSLMQQLKIVESQMHKR